MSNHHGHAPGGRAERREQPVTGILGYTHAELNPELELQKWTMRTSSIGQEPSQVGLNGSERQHA